jgi:MFS transporter, NNP family, nitrate/nitrite transporter
MLPTTLGIVPYRGRNTLPGGMIMIQPRGTPAAGLTGATLGFFIGFAAVSLFGPTAKILQDTTGISPALAGLLISIPNLSGSLLRIPFAAMVDTNGGRKQFIILMVLSVIGILGLYIIMTRSPDVIANAYPLLLLFGILGGCGIATFSVGIGQTSYWFPQKRQGRALGTYAGIGNLAPGIFAFLLANYTIPRYGLAGSYLIWFVFVAIGTVIYMFIGRNAWFFQFRKAGASAEVARTEAGKLGQELFPKASLIESLKSSAAVWQTWALVAVYFTTFGGFMALTAWLPKYWNSLHGVSLATAGSLAALYSVVASLLRVAGGPVTDKVGGEKTAQAALVATLAGAVILAFNPAIGLSVVAIVLMAVGMGVGNAAVFKLVPHYVPHSVGGAAGWVGGLGAFGGFVIPNILSAFLRTGETGDAGYATGFVTFAGLAAVSIVIVAVLQRQRKKHE